MNKKKFGLTINNKELIATAKQIWERSDRLIVWNTKHYPDYLLIENRFHQCDFYQLEEEKYNPQMKRLWVYVNHPENKLMYICEVVPVRGKLPIKPACNICQEFKSSESIKEYNKEKPNPMYLTKYVNLLTN